MLNLILMRGWPGSGKSFLAKQLARRFKKNSGQKVVVLSTDNFWYLEDPAKYQFDMAKIADAHAWNQAQCQAAIEEYERTFDGTVGTTIIIDNANILCEHTCPYTGMYQWDMIYQCLPKDVESTAVLLQDNICSLRGNPSAPGALAALHKAFKRIARHWRRNIHDVPLSSVIRMAEQLEHSDLAKMF